MQRVDCRFEQDLLDAIAAQRWPARCDDALQRHVNDCSSCADLALVADALNGAGSERLDDVRVPTAGTMWWRAHTRARREALREAERPITVAQVFGFGAAIAALVALTWASSPLLAGLREMMPALPSVDFSRPAEFDFPRVIAELQRWRWLVAAALGWLVLAPLAVYFALLED